MPRYSLLALMVLTSLLALELALWRLAPGLVLLPLLVPIVLFWVALAVWVVYLSLIER